MCRNGWHSAAKRLTLCHEDPRVRSGISRALPVGESRRCLHAPLWRVPLLGPSSEPPPLPLSRSRRGARFICAPEGCCLRDDHLPALRAQLREPGDDGHALPELPLRRPGRQLTVGSHAASAGDQCRVQGRHSRWSRARHRGRWAVPRLLRRPSDRPGRSAPPCRYGAHVRPRRPWDRTCAPPSCHGRRRRHTGAHRAERNRHWPADVEAAACRPARTRVVTW